jgi:hypothetical protein
LLCFTIKSTNGLQDKKITLKDKGKTEQMYNVEPTEYGQRKIKIK